MPRERLISPLFDVEQSRQKSRQLSGLESIIGQRRVIDKLRSLSTLSTNHGRLPGHVLLVGPDGAGKRTTAREFAAEIGSTIKEMDESARTSHFEFLGLLTNIEANDILLVSNIGNLSKKVREFFLPCLTEFRVEIVLDKGMYARKIDYMFKPFTLIATCQAERDCPPDMVDAFLPPLRFEPYSNAELSQICAQIAERDGISVTAEAAARIASLSCGGPRQVEIILRRLEVAGKAEIIDDEFASKMLSALGFPVEGQGTLGTGNQIDTLSGIEFERLITEILVCMGFQTETTKASGDGGVDIVATLNKPITGGRYIIQCKRYAPDSLVGAATVREFYGALNADQRAVKGILITTSGFTAQAIEFARELRIELIGRDQLHQIINECGVASNNSSTTSLFQ